MSSHRSRIVLVALVLLVVGVMHLLPLMPRFLNRYRYASMEDGCHSLLVAQDLPPEIEPSAYQWPYGVVHACRVLDRIPHMFGERSNVANTSCHPGARRHQADTMDRSLRR